MQPGDYATGWDQVVGPILVAVAVVVILTWYIVFVQRRRK